MNKLGILGIVITIAFVTWVLTSNPDAEGVSGWQAAVIEIEEFLSQEEISQLFDFDLVSVENQDECEDGQVAKRDSDLDSGWSCQNDETGDGGGGGPGDSSDKFRLNPQTMEPVGCDLSNLGTMYYRDVNEDNTGPDALCVCTIIEGAGPDEFEYWDVINGEQCTTP